MDAVEAAVAENDHDIAGFCQRLEALNDRVGGGFVESRFASGCNVGDDLIRLEALVFGQLVEAGDLRNKNPVGLGKSFWQVVLKHGASGGVRSRFKESPQTDGAEFFAKPGERFADGGRVVTEVVDDRDAVDCATNFLAAADALEGCQRGADFFDWNAVVVGCRGGHGGVADIEVTRKWDRECLVK